MSKTYWKGVEELRNDAEFVRLKNNEFPEHLPLDEVLGEKAADITTTPRRDFLKFLGFSVAAASLAACEAPVRKTIPYLVKPEQVTPGVADWYASTYFDGYDYSSILVKTREGRPIKIEGNVLSGVTKGGVNARVQASVLSLYDSARLKNPVADGGPSTWANVDGAIKSKLDELAAKKGNIRILSSTIISPSTRSIIKEFASKYPTTKHITYDAVSCSAMLQANKESFGVEAIPSYNFDKANVIVAFDCDFLVNWISPIEHSRLYAETRKLNNGKKEMSRHIQFESALSLTGSNADKRIGIKPSMQGAAIANLYNAVAKLAGVSTVNAASVGENQKDIEATAKELWENKGKSVVVCGINHVAIQNLVNGMNSLLGNYGTTVDLDNPCMLRQGNDAELASLMDEMNKGEVAALFIYNSNPVYTLSNSFAEALKKVSLSVSFSDRADETASQCKFICPDHHQLESWGDAEPKKDQYSLTQPTIAPLFSTRQFQESLLVWSGNAITNYHDYLKSYWKEFFFKNAPLSIATEDHWNKLLQSGVFGGALMPAKNYQSSANLNTSADAVSKMSGSGIEMVVYEKTGIGNGLQANNPWLQELPDPVSKVTWDNYLAVSPKDAREKGWLQGNVVQVKANGNTVKVPVFIQPGQMPGTVSLAIGYGRTKTGKVADNVGVNAYVFASMIGGNLSYSASGVEISKTTDEDHVLATTQSHHTMMGRAIVKETTLEEYIRKPNAGNEEELFAVRVGKEEVKKTAKEVNLWDDHAEGNHHWGMSIDLNSCIGCGSCVVACTAENNVAVVGKAEVIRSREMHWMRIDRYFSSDADPKEGEKGDIKKMENPSDMPKVVFQPVMCQHCAHAPCETVCPVIATSHSSEGMNQMIYNRCVGTRYCANNCPYKVRRFNWFKYSDNAKFDFNMNDDLGKMVLNPDVVVRSRGVMEKCSLCVQRIQEVKLNAKRDGRTVKDGEVKTACSQSCPTQAITFGDYKVKDSELNKMWKPEERSYHLLEELDVQPNVFYQTKVRNVEEEKHS
ncbi:MAG: TAT-variant-translocated molybdopterin oxidoreductase [Bacteroidetes bacterium]|nr:TAT-variant-translocated molybdopterin oxidoreductase [Bacteroidota bacterium]